MQIVSGSGQLKSIGTSKTASNFFEGTSYSDKVKYQMSQGVDELHSFPEEVINFSSEGKIEKIIGNDGKSIQNCPLLEHIMVSLAILNL